VRVDNSRYGNEDAPVHWPDLIVGGVIGAAFTLAVGYILYRLQAQRDAPSLAFQSSSVRVVTQSEEEVGGLDLEVRFKGNTVPRLTRTRMAIWNPRWAVVNGADIAEKDPLRIVFRGAEVLDARPVTETREAIQFDATARDGACFIDFDFFDRHDGAVLDLLHTGSDTDRPSIQGTVKGLPAGVSYYGPLTKPIPTAATTQQTGLTSVSGQLAFVSFLGAAIFVAFGISKTHSHAPNTLWWLYLGAGLCFAAGLLSVTIVWSRRLPTALRAARSRVRVTRADATET
jgi:hypothetical protein